MNSQDCYHSDNVEHAQCDSLDGDASELHQRAIGVVIVLVCWALCSLTIRILLWNAYQSQVDDALSGIYYI